MTDKMLEKMSRRDVYKVENGDGELKLSNIILDLSDVKRL